MPRNMTLVTGAGGFIGSALVSALLSRACGVVAVDQDSGKLDQFSRQHPDTDRLKILQADITDQTAIMDVVMGTKPTAIVHLAALHLIPVCEAMPQRTVEVNIDGLLNVLKAAEHSQTEFVLFASSAEVYGSSGEPLAETDPVRPSSVYGASKLLGERMVAEWAARLPGRRATSLRIFNVYGPGDSNPHVIPDILDGLRNGGEIRVGNVESSRDFIHVDDLVYVLCRVLECAVPPTLVNVGSGLATSVAELLSIIQTLVGRPLTWSSDSAKVRADDRLCLRADPSRLRSVFPRFAPRDLDTGLGDVLTATGLHIGSLDPVA